MNFASIAMQWKDALVFGFPPNTQQQRGLFFAQNHHKVGKIMGGD